MKRVQKDDTKLFYSNPKSREVLKQKVRQVFNLFDTDGSGEIDAHEFHDLIYSMGKIMTDEEVAKYLAVLDRDGNGSISFDEFFDWWCTRDDSHSKDHSADKLKEVKAKLQSRSWMRSISYLINKAKNDLEAQKSKAQNNTNTSGSTNDGKSSNGADPNTLVMDWKIKIGNMAPEDAKMAIKMSYIRMDTPAKIYRLEFQLTDGATDQDAEKIKQAFVRWNYMMSGLIFQDISLTITTHGNVRHATLEMQIENAGPAEAALKNANLSKLQVSLESSQSLEELNLKTIKLNLGFYMEASRLIYAMLPPAAAIGPVYHGFMMMTRRFAFEFEFGSLHEAVASSLQRERLFANLNTSKQDMAKQFRTQLTMLGISPDLPIATLKQVLVQVEHSAFVLDLSGLDLSFLFKSEAPKEINAPQVDAPQSVPINVPLTVTKEPEVVVKEPEVIVKEPEVVVHEPEVPPHMKIMGIINPSEALVAWMSQFSDIQDESASMDEETKQVILSAFEEYHPFSANRTDPTTGKVMSVLLDKFTPKDLSLHQQELNMFHKMKGFPHVYEYMDLMYEAPYAYLASVNIRKLGYKPLWPYILEQRALNVAWTDYEPIAKQIAQKVLNATMVFAKTHVTYSLAEVLVIHPETLDIRLESMGLFREAPVTGFPEGVPPYNMPPELFTLEGMENYGAEVDVWSYGVLCYAILTGTLPYDLELGEEVMNYVVAGEWNKTALHFTGLPEKARNFISRILVTDKKARPTFNEISNDEFFRN